MDAISSRNNADVPNDITPTDLVARINEEAKKYTGDVRFSAQLVKQDPASYEICTTIDVVIEPGEKPGDAPLIGSTYIVRQSGLKIPLSIFSEGPLAGCEVPFVFVSTQRELIYPTSFHDVRYTETKYFSTTPVQRAMSHRPLGSSQPFAEVPANFDDILKIDLNLRCAQVEMELVEKHIRSALPQRVLDLINTYPTEIPE